MKPRLFIPPLSFFGICGVIFYAIFFKQSLFLFLSYLIVYILTVIGFIFGRIAYKEETGTLGEISFICSLVNVVISVLITLFFLIAFPSHMGLAREAVYKAGEAAYHAEETYKINNGTYTNDIDKLKVISEELRERPFITFKFMSVSESGFTLSSYSDVAYYTFIFSNTEPFPEF